MNHFKLDFLPTNLKNYIATLPSEFKDIPEARRTDLLRLSAYIRAKQMAQQPIRITVICTHNSRRSHIGQIWLQVAAACYEVQNFQSFSGGTEATAFYPSAVDAVRKTGVQLEAITDSSNPIYRIQFSETQPSFNTFSKIYYSDTNPAKDFAAVMVCTSADEACPIVIGADARFAFPFDDPKAFDGTDLEAAKYSERARQIAREFFFAISEV